MSPPQPVVPRPKLPSDSKDESYGFWITVVKKLCRAECATEDAHLEQEELEREAREAAQAAEETQLRKEKERKAREQKEHKRLD